MRLKNISFFKTTLWVAELGFQPDQICLILRPICFFLISCWFMSFNIFSLWYYKKLLFSIGHFCLWNGPESINIKIKLPCYFKVVVIDVVIVSVVFRKYHVLQKLKRNIKIKEQHFRDLVLLWFKWNLKFKWKFRLDLLPVHTVPPEGDSWQYHFLCIYK